MNVLKQLENAPKNLVLYFVGLIGAVVDDYALVTLLIFSVLLGLQTSVLIAATAFFGLYFVLRLVSTHADAVGFTGKANAQNAQATMQVAAALAQFHQPEDTQSAPDPSA